MTDLTPEQPRLTYRASTETFLCEGPFESFVFTRERADSLPLASWVRNAIPGAMSQPGRAWYVAIPTKDTVRALEESEREDAKPK